MPLKSAVSSRLDGINSERKHIEQELKKLSPKLKKVSKNPCFLRQESNAICIGREGA